MARRRKAYRRDQYGRYKGKGGLKPWKNNNPNFYKSSGYRPKRVARGSGRHNATSGYRPQGVAKPIKKSNKKRNIIIGTVAIGAVAAGGAYGVHKYRASRVAPTTPQAGKRFKSGRMSQGLDTAGANVQTGAAVARTGSASPVAVRGTGMVGGMRSRLTPRGAAVAMPVSMRNPSKVNAKTLLTTAAAVSSVAAASTAPSDEDRAVDKATNSSKDRWARIEAARQAGIPKAVDFIDGGGTDAQIREAARGGKSVVTKPAVNAVPGIVRKESQQRAAVDQVKLKTNFSKGYSAISMKPKDYGLVNENGNTLRVFPKSNLSQRTTLRDNYLREKALTVRKQTVKPRPGAVTPSAKQTSTPNTPTVGAAGKAAPNVPLAPLQVTAGTKAAKGPDPAKSAQAARRVTPQRAAYSAPRPIPAVNTKNIEDMTPDEARAFLNRRSKQLGQQRGLTTGRNTGMTLNVKHTSQASIKDGGVYRPTSEPGKKVKKKRGQ